MKSTLLSRVPWLLGFGACAAAMAFALYLEHGRGMEPCPMCVFQRVAMIVTGLVFLITAFIGPRGWGRWLAAALTVLPAGAGAFVAGRHVWLQNLPEDQVPACGAGLEAMLDMFPLQEVVRMVLTGDGNCAKIDAMWMGISLPGWVLIGFIALMLWSFVCLFATRERV